MSVTKKLSQSQYMQMLVLALTGFEGKRVSRPVRFPPKDLVLQPDEMPQGVNIETVEKLPRKS